MRCKKIILTLTCLCMSLLIHAQLNTDRITSIGRNALYFDDYVLSIQYFNQVIKLKPYLAEPYLLRAIAKIQLSDFSGALRDCNTSIECNPFQSGAYYTRGFIYRQLEDWDRAEEDFTKALHFSPENRTYLILRADVRAQKKEFALAMEDIEYLLRRDPKSPSLLFEKGVICIGRQDTTCALNAFEGATRYDSQNSSNWSALGMTQLSAQLDNDALISLNKAISLGSKWAGDYINRGIIYYNQHNYRKALADFDHAITLAPQNAQCYYHRGILRAELGDNNRAIDDLDKAIDLEPDKVELRYQRATVLLSLQQWSQALEDLDILIARYPFFLPSYYLAAQAKTALGESKAAFQYRKKAFDLEQKKDSILAADTIQTPNTGVHIAQSQMQSRDRRKEFSARTAQNQSETNESENEYTSQTRGSVQRRYTDVINEPNIALSYYGQNASLRQTNYSHASLDTYNRLSLLPSSLKLVVQEISLTAEMVNQHFDQISKFSRQIDIFEKQYTTYSRLNAQRSSLDIASLYLARAMEFALVQDYSSAMDDCTKALNQLFKLKNTSSNEENQLAAIITFCRANWRYKLLEYRRATGELTAESAMDFEIMLRDYDYVNQLLPDFSFAYYNKANMLCAQKEYQSAIAYYNKAIEIDGEFAEAYFNRGLTRIYTDDVDGGIADLSQAGELGIYQAYNLITRFQ